MNRADEVRQLSLDGEFTTAPEEDQPQPATPLTARENPRKLQSAYGIEPPVSSEPAAVIVDGAGKVVEHHIGWLAACAEHRPIRVVERRYDSGGRHDAAAREAETAAVLTAHTKEFVEVAVIAANDAQVPVREVARRLHKSPSLISRIIGRVQVRQAHPDLARQLTDSHLEAVVTCEAEQQRQLLERAVADHLSVHDLEQLVRDSRIAFRQIVGTDQRYLGILESSGLSKLAPDWKDRAHEWVAWFKAVQRATDPSSRLLPRGNKRHGRAA